MDERVLNPSAFSLVGFEWKKVCTAKEVGKLALALSSNFVVENHILSVLF